MITTDYVVSETLTLLLMRGQRRQAESFGRVVFGGRLAQLRVSSLREILAAWEVFLKFNDKQWSFTDCTSKVVIEQLQVTTAFSFDHHFRQFGTITVVP